MQWAERSVHFASAIARLGSRKSVLMDHKEACALLL
jgi:hypothetical protein